jgi:CRP/FNR family transcriptional regulator, cyclic AMP receptor protein
MNTMIGRFGRKNDSNSHSDASEPDLSSESAFFSTAFSASGVNGSLLMSWESRAVEVDARRLDAERGKRLLQTVWGRDKYMSQLEAGSIGSLSRYFDFASLASNRDVIRQDEYGNFMVVLLTGSIAVDRVQPWGERLRLAEARPGDILGEMSLLDSGIRFSSCTSIIDCELAVLSAEGMDDMMGRDPKLAASLVALLARKLSLRLRMVSARLSDNRPGESK